MTFTVHALTGAAAGAALGQPGLAFVAGVASHALLDAIPHRDYSGPVHAALDVAAGALLTGALAWTAGGFGEGAVPLIAAGWLWGALGGVLPDLEVAAAYLAGRRGRRWPLFFPSHTGLTPHREARGLRGVLTQAVTGLVAAALLGMLL